MIKNVHISFDAPDLFSEPFTISKDEPRFHVSHQKTPSGKPHKIFKNWNESKQPPWLPFIQTFIFALYICIALYHQVSNIQFSTDFSQIIKSYFMEDMSLLKSPVGINTGAGQIYKLSDLSNNIHKICSRFFTFPDELVCSYQLLPEEKAHFKLDLPDSVVECHFNAQEIQFPEELVQMYFYTFQTIEIQMTYTLQMTSKYTDQYLYLDLKALFTHDPDTQTVFFELTHTRALNDRQDVTFLDDFSQSCSCIIIALDIISLVITWINMRQETKMRGWDIYGIFNHFFSLAAMVCNLIFGGTFTQHIPPIVVLLFIASLIQTLSFFNFLHVVPTTKLVVNVLSRAVVKLLQFLCGCVFFYLAAILFVVTIFGHLKEDFATPLQAATFLFCVLHNDSIIEFFTALTEQYDVPYWESYGFGMAWLLISLSMIYNIVISIMEEVTDVEDYKLKHAKEKERRIPSIAQIIVEMGMLGKFKDE